MRKLLVAIFTFFLLGSALAEVPKDITNASVITMADGTLLVCVSVQRPPGMPAHLVPLTCAAAMLSSPAPCLGNQQTLDLACKP